MDDLYGYLLKDEQLKGMFENWGYDDKILVSRCSDLLSKIKSYLYIFDYPSVKEGARKDITFNDACLNNILQIRKLLTQLPKTHIEALQKLGIIVIAPNEIRVNPFIPFNDIVIKNMEKVFSDILGLQSSVNEDVKANSKFKVIIRGIDFKNNEQIDKTRARLERIIDSGDVNLIKDVLSLFNFVERLEYHLQRCEVNDFRSFVNDKACMDAVSYTLIEAIKCLSRASEETKKYYNELCVDVVRLSKIHVAIVKKGMSPFELINENYYVEELWGQIKTITDVTFALANIALR